MAKKHVWSDDDEADITEGLGGEPEDPENPNGAVMVEEEKVREIGAVDAESVRANRRNESIIGRKKAGEKHVPFNETDVLLRYDQAVKLWGADTMSVYVTRLGSHDSTAITSHPNNSVELLAEIKKLHGRREEATYALAFQDIVHKQKRGTGRITIPNSLGELSSSQGQSNMNQPPGYQPGFPQPQPQQSGYPQPQPPVVQVMPSPPQQSADPLAMMKQVIEMQRLMQQHQQPTPQASVPQQFTQQPPDMMLQMMEMMRMLQPPPVQQQPPPQPVYQPPPPVQPPAPAPAAPDANAMMLANLTMMQKMFEMFKSMQPASAPAPAPAPVQTPVEEFESRRPYRVPTYGGGPSYGGGPRPQYTRPPQYMGEPGYGPPQQPGYPPQYPGYGPPPPAPAPQKGVVEQFRESVTVIQQMQNLMGQFQPQQDQHQQGGAPEAEESPVRVIDVGPAKMIVNTDDGSTRGWESVMANVPAGLKWAGEQFEKLQKNAIAAQQQRQQAPQQLPPGYVEVTPGYQPPPGYVAIPIDQIPQQAQAAQQFPAPPTNLPPVMQQEEEPKPAWGMPSGDGQ